MSGDGYDAVLVVSFGGPEGPDDVEPFLDQVLRGRPVSPQRRAAVAAHYDHFAGHSPINDHTRALVAALEAELRAHGDEARVYWGNRNWHPFLADTVARMRDDGIERALAFVTSAYASYSGCHQYLEDLARARAEVGAGAPVIDKLRVFYNHPGFVEANADALYRAWGHLGGPAAVAFTAHSIPVSMAETCDYQAQLATTGRLVVEAALERRDRGDSAGRGDRGGRGDPAGLGDDGRFPWSVVFQSRSGPPHVPWLGPDIGDHLRHLAAQGVESVVVAPIGFVADHMEVVYDLDVEAAALARSLGLTMVRAATAGVHPAFVAMIRQLIDERRRPSTAKLAMGTDGPYHDVCRVDCCLAPATPAARR